VTFPVLQLLEEGYEIQVSADASASHTRYGDDLALRRMEKAGAVITTVDQTRISSRFSMPTPCSRPASASCASHGSTLI
jgi:hypothetical protein